MIKSLLIAALLLVANTFGAVTSVSNLSNTNTTIVATPVVITELTLFSTNTTPTIVYLYDGSLTVTNSAYTNYTTSVSTEVESYVGANGLTNAWTNSVITVAANEVAEETVDRTPVATLVVPANNVPVTITPNVIFTYSAILSNNLAGISGIITYRTP